MKPINKMTLYQRPDCPFCWKVRLFLFESELQIKEVQVELGEKHPDVVRLNPNTTVPVLVTGDLVIYDSYLIIEYLIDKYPEINLIPGTPEDRATTREIQYYSDNKLGKVLFPYIKYLRENSCSDTGEKLKKSTALAWTEVQSILSDKLGNKDYFSIGFSLADCALIPRFSLAIAYGFEIDDQFINLREWYARCMQRLSFQKAFPDVFRQTD